MSDSECLTPCCTTCAFWAHAGGFLAGVLLILVFKDDELVAKHRAMAKYA